MTDAPHETSPEHDSPFGDAEPPRDLALGALLHDVVGPVPTDRVDWTALASRISAARTRQGATWWSYAAGWERRALPLALAASLAGILTLWSLGSPTAAPVTSTPVPSDPVTALMDGIASADAARSWAQSVTSADLLAAGEVY